MTLANRLRKRLAGPAPEGLLAGDHPDLTAARGTPAAVLAAITDRTAPGLILTVRREHMRTHAGQVAFPGGRIDAGEDAVTAALREAHEEILLPAKLADVVGELMPYLTVTDYVVTPVVAVIPPDLPLRPQEEEVADWFEVPLDFVLDPANQHRRSGLFQGETRHYYEIDWQGRRIWGATAAMIVNLSRKLQWG